MFGGILLSFPKSTLRVLATPALLIIFLDSILSPFSIMTPTAVPRCNFISFTPAFTASTPLFFSIKSEMVSAIILDDPVG